jgi:hypothetical protein
MHDDYKQLDLSQLVSAPGNGHGPTLEACPICGSEGQLWQYSESETAPRKLLVMCSHGDRIGPQDGLTNEGCPFYMPPDAHYRETIRDAVRYWNELAKAINSLRRKNGWARASVLRSPVAGVPVTPAAQPKGGA